MKKHFKANSKNGMGKKGSMYRTQTIKLGTPYDANQKSTKTIIHSMFNR